MPGTPRLELTLLGGFDCRLPGGAALAFPTRKVGALLAFLAVDGARPHARDKLAALLWGDMNDGQARANLRKALSRLRRTLPERAARCVAVDAGTVAIRAADVAIDVACFERLAAEGTPESLERAAALYRGPFLDGFGDCGEPFHEWLAGKRRRLDELLQQALRRLLDHHAATGAVDRAIHAALRLLALDPLQEEVHRTLIRLYLVQDRVGAALEQYRQCRAVLARELDVEPEDETERLHAEIRAAAPPSGDAGAPSVETDGGADHAGASDGVARRRAPRPAAAASRPCVAVLPFTTDVADVASRHLGDGLAEDIATELGRFPELDVIAPASARVYRDAPPERAGAALGAGHVVHGSVRAVEAAIRTTVCLVEAPTGRQRWAERYQRPRDQLLDVRDDVVHRIVAAVVGGIERARLAALRSARPGDWRAYDLWLRGWAALRRVDAAAIAEARASFERAAAQDPGFAGAYSGLALARWKEWACFAWSPWIPEQREMLELAERAVALDDRDHRAHCILGMAQLYARDYAGARRRLVRALELNPGDADVLAHAAFGLALVGEHDVAVEAGRAALQLQPHHPDWYAGLVGIALFGARLHEEVVETMTPAPEGFCSAPAFLAAAHAHLGRPAAGVRFRETVYRHYRYRLQRGEIAAGTSCMAWLLAIDPFQLPADAEHYASGLRLAGFR